MNVSSGPQASQRGGWQLLLHPKVSLVLIAGVAYCFQVAVPLVTGVPAWAGLYVGSLLFALLSLALVGAGARWRTNAWEEGLVAAVFLILWVVVGQLEGASAAATLYIAPAANILFLLSCLFIGKVLSRIVRERAMTLPVCIVAALADLFTVYWGPTGLALEKAPELVRKLSFAIPAAGSAVGPQGARGLTHVATMGLGDFIFLALFMSLAVRFGFPVVRTFWAMVVGAWVGIIILLAAPRAVPGMPLLPYMSLGFVLANLREFRLSPQERRDLVIALGLLLLLFGLAIVALRQ